MSLILPTALAIANAIISLLIVALGIYVYRHYEGRGVRMFALFCGLFGASIAQAQAVAPIIFSYGITTASELRASQEMLPASVFVIAFVSDLLLTLLILTYIVWFGFVLLYTLQLSDKVIQRLRYGAVALGLLYTANLILFSLGTIQTLGLNIPPDIVNASQIILAAMLVVIPLGGLFAGIAYLYYSYSRTELIPLGLIVALTFPAVGGAITQIIAQITGNTVLQTYVLAAVLPLSLLSLWLSLTRYRLFERVPAASGVGRDNAMDSVASAIVLTDMEGRITDINATGETLFGVDDREATGEHIKTIVPEQIIPQVLSKGGQATFPHGNDNKVIQARTTATTSKRDVQLGYTINFSDITTERRRQQRIQVLSRVLRHNLRNELNVVSGYSEILATQNNGNDEYAAQIQDKIDELTSLGEKAGDIESVLNADPSASEPVRLADVLDQIRTEHSERASITIDVPEQASLRVNLTVLTPVLRELVNNAIEHSDTHPSIELTYDSADRTLMIEDDGPGIPEEEIEVLESGTETPLNHGSGLGLWLVRWGTDYIGGTLDFDASPDGTVVKIVFPDTLVAEQSDYDKAGETQLGAKEADVHALE